jgi:redox-sensitive bicupin YhaK (pirin superfamily)
VVHPPLPSGDPGSVTNPDPGATPEPGPTTGPELSPSRVADVGGARVRRALPQRGRRTIGAWCFADHLGPVAHTRDTPVAVGPHPHIGLQTVTWLLEGAMLHRDSLGSVQTIRPGQLNLMTAGDAVSHAEEPIDDSDRALHGTQLWVAQPDATRHGPAAFTHHAELPTIDLANGRAVVLVGRLDGVHSPVVHDTPLVGADLEIHRGVATVPLAPAFEHGVVVLEGALSLEGTTVVPGELAYLGPGRDELSLSATGTARLMLLGGEPFEAPVLMWWNFVGRSRSELTEAVAAWNRGSDRFGDSGSPLARIPAPATPWRS